MSILNLFFTKAKVSPQGKVNIEDLKSILRSTLIFIAPAVLMYLGQLQGSLGGALSWDTFVPNQMTIGSIYGWFLGILINIFLKLQDGKK